MNLTISAFPISSLIHNSFWFSRIHLHFALGQRFISIFYAQIFWDVVRLDLLTLILLTWRIWWSPNNASKWQMEFNSAFKGLTSKPHIRRSLQFLLTL
jgi:hypothetical protein